MKKIKIKQKELGITLVALVVTVVILIILASITLRITFKDKGIINQAQKSTELYSNAEARDQEVINELSGELANALYEPAEPEQPEQPEEPPKEPEEPEQPPIDKVNTKVGYYADINGDKTPDGVIYADLAVSKSGQWTDGGGKYSYNAIKNPKDYYVSDTDYEGPFGTKDVLTAIEGSAGEERFYVMALKDIDGKRNGTYYDWYNAAYNFKMEDYKTATSGDFGTGKKNTETMIAKWNAEGYGAKDQCANHKDMWGQIQNEVESGWFVPSRGEWSAFAGELGIDKINYVNLGLSDWYWSSSQLTTSLAWGASFSNGYMFSDNVNGYYYVRLSATF